MSSTLDNPKKLSNIYLIGAQSTGKTTLAHALLRSLALHYPHHPPILITELARDVLKEGNFTAAEIRNSKTRCLELQRQILEKQFEVELEFAKKGSWFISDRSAVDPLVYAEMYVGEKERDGMVTGEAWGWLRRKMKEALVVLLEPVQKWMVDDGVRLIPVDVEEWRETNGRFRRLLEREGIGYITLGENLEDLQARVDFVGKCAVKHSDENQYLDSESE